jgi:hypothetical protein
MTSIPTLEIIFALFLMILPDGTTSFTIQRDVDKSPIVWTLQEDGSWSGLTEDGMTTFGSWRLDGMKVVSISSSGEKSVDVSKWIVKEDTGFLVEGKPLKIAKVSDSTTWLLHTAEGLFEKTVRIETKK